jgi:dUTPase
MAKESIKFLKTREVKSPTRSYSLDAGIDFYVPVFTSSFIKDLKLKNIEFFHSELYNQGYNQGYTLGNPNNCINNGTLVISGKDKSIPSISYDLKDDNNSFFKFDEESGNPYFLLPPHGNILIPSGIHSYMAKPGRALIAANKSGIASKYGIIFGAQVVDYSYQGEIHINILNTSTKMVRIYENMKIIQFLETPIYNSEIEVTEGNDLSIPIFYEGMVVDRGAAGFGSTDKK